MTQWAGGEWSATSGQALRLIDTAATDGIDSLVAAFDLTYEKFVAAGVLMKPDRDECRREFLTRRSSYEGRVRRIATLMPIDEPWVFPQAKSTA